MPMNISFSSDMGKKSFPYFGEVHPLLLSNIGSKQEPIYICFEATQFPNSLKLGRKAEISRVQKRVLLRKRQKICYSTAGNADNTFVDTDCGKEKDGPSSTRRDAILAYHDENAGEISSQKVL